MREFENDPNEMNEDPVLPDRDDETGGDRTEPPREEPSFEKKEEQSYRSEPYGGGYEKAPKKQGGSMFLIVFCLVLSIFVGVSAGALFSRDEADETKGGDLYESTSTSTSGGETSTGSASSDTASTSNTTSATAGTVETAPGVTVTPSITVPVGTYRSIVERCIDSVVVINVTETAISYGQEREVAGAGSGVLYTADGYIVTNYHVANENSKTITVTLYDGTQYEGKYIYGDQYVDLAVIKIDKNDCKHAVFADSKDVFVGDQVLAIGNPLGYGITVTDGIVSALDKAITVENTTMVLLQTSAEINSGNSGGGLFNMNGELIGIVNAKIAGTSVEGMGYAIPSSVVVKSLNDLREHGYITGKARLGVTVQTKQYQTWPYLQTYSYIQVSEINPNGSAATSGLKVGDILYEFNGTEITSFEVLSQQLTKYKVGDTVKLTVRRPTVELTSNNLSQYLETSEKIELTLTFVEFNPNA